MGCGRCPVVRSTSFRRRSTGSVTFLQKKSFAVLQDVAIAHSFSIGINAQSASSAVGTAILCLHNQSLGISAEINSNVTVYSGSEIASNASFGASAAEFSRLNLTRCTIELNSSYAVYCSNMSFAFVFALVTSGTTTQRTEFATDLSGVYQASTHVGSPVFSPAIGTTGNNEAITR
ncbi:MAG: hypothetical protein RLZ98_3748 [Pseudomonadota bacterium]|jgi:hypothetical protein